MRHIRLLRLVTGLVLASFVAIHFANHSLGLLSVDAQEAMREALAPFYRNRTVMALLVVSFVTHFSLGLFSLWRRSTLRLPRWELAQLLLGLCIPPLLLPHAVRALIAPDPSYPSVLESLWSDGWGLARQSLLVVVLTAHLGIGLHFWLRLRSGYRRWAALLHPAVLLLPVLALLGFLRAGLEVQQRAATKPASASAADYAYEAAPSAPPGVDVQRRVEITERTAFAVYGGGLLLVVAGREVRRRLRLRRGSFRIHHSSGRTIVAPLGQTLLEAVRDAGIPHAAVCGGRARCTTCRVRVGAGAERLPVPEPMERQALARIDADPNVRLACQTRPVDEIHVTPLIPCDATAVMAGRHGGVRGRERAVVVMFIDLWGSSRLGEDRLPYDVIFILNRFFAEMAEAVHASRGYYSTFNGDGLMALYGTEGDLRSAARDAMRGAALVCERLAALNRSLASELPRPLRVGIGLHAGEAIVGTMGPPATPILSALGDTVNVTSRLESLTRVHDCTMVVSDACAAAAQVDLSSFPAHEVVVRGRSKAVRYFAVTEPERLSALVDGQEAAAAAMAGP